MKKSVLNNRKTLAAVRLPTCVVMVECILSNHEGLKQSQTFGIVPVHALAVSPLVHEMYRLLCHCRILQRNDVKFEELHSFVEDRIRSILQDMTIQVSLSERGEND